MKIAIMTWFRYHNYGTTLQVTALYKYLSDKGHAVDVIDYSPRRRPDDITVNDYTLGAYIRMKQRIKKQSPWEPYVEPFETCERAALFEDFIQKKITLTPTANLMTDLEDLNEAYECFICGSDQIWSPLLYDSHYFLDFVADRNKMIAYAPSLGQSQIEDRFVRSAMKECIGRFEHLSIREETGAEIIQTLTGQKAQVVVDPTLLLDPHLWRTFCKKVTASHPYMLVYFLGSDPVHLEKAKDFATRNNLQLMIIPTFMKDVQEEECIQFPVGPEEFISLIAGASYVCTDSFHGVLLSFIFRKPFFVFERFKKGSRNNQNSRIYNILKRTGLEDLLIPYSGILKNGGQIDYNTVWGNLYQEIERSKEYLDHALASVQHHQATTAKRVLEDHSLCCGCGACSYICPKGAIQILIDEQGFWRASVDDQKCIRCGRCKSVCPYEGKSNAVPPNSFSLYSYKDNRPVVLKESSSGGFAYALSEMFLQEKGPVIGCLFDETDKRAKHCRAVTLQELSSFQGSKYIQSYFKDAFYLIKGKTTLVFGTPCQIAASRKVFGDTEDIVYVDLICHGVPSYHLFDRYIDYSVKKFGLNREAVKISFRWKERGWREIYIYVTDSDKAIATSQHEDFFFRTFEAMNCYMESCYECRWRDGSAADIRIGDYWGPRFKEDNTGVSMVAAVTQRGRELLDEFSRMHSGDLQPQPLEDLFKYQQTENGRKPLYRTELINQLKKGTDLRFIVDKYDAPFEFWKKTKKERARRLIRMLFDENVRRIH